MPPFFAGVERRGYASFMIATRLIFLLIRRLPVYATRDVTPSSSFSSEPDTILSPRDAPFHASLLFFFCRCQRARVDVVYTLFTLLPGRVGRQQLQANVLSGNSNTHNINITVNSDDILRDNEDDVPSATLIFLRAAMLTLRHYAAIVRFTLMPCREARTTTHGTTTTRAQYNVYARARRAARNSAKGHNVAAPPHAILPLMRAVSYTTTGTLRRR